MHESVPTVSAYFDLSFDTWTRLYAMLFYRLFFVSLFLINVQIFLSDNKENLVLSYLMYFNPFFSYHTQCHFFSSHFIFCFFISCHPFSSYLILSDLPLGQASHHRLALTAGPDAAPNVCLSCPRSWPIWRVFGNLTRKWVDILFLSYLSYSLKICHAFYIIVV